MAMLVGYDFADRQDRQKLVADVEAAMAESKRLVRVSAVIVAASQAARDRAMLTRCAWCDRIELGRQWVAREEVPSLAPGIASRATHGICADCIAELRRTGKSR